MARRANIKSWWQWHGILYLITLACKFKSKVPTANRALVWVPWAVIKDTTLGNSQADIHGQAVDTKILENILRQILKVCWSKKRIKKRVRVEMLPQQRLVWPCTQEPNVYVVLFQKSQAPTLKSQVCRKQVLLWNEFKRTFVWASWAGITRITSVRSGLSLLCSPRLVH